MKSDHSSRRKQMLFCRQVRSCVLGCALLIVSGYAQAHVFCVSNAGELQNALTESSDGGLYNGEDDFVRVVKGTYKIGSATGNLPFRYRSTAANGQILILGGYNAACTVQTEKASLTVLDGIGATQVLSIRRSTTNVVVINLTIQNGETNEPGGGLAVNVGSGDNSGVDIEDNIIRNNHTTSQAGGLYARAGADGNDLFVQNNVIAGNSADGDFGAGKLIGNSTVAAVDNNTVTRNITAFALGAGGLYFGGTAANAYIANNIFWNNTNYGIYIGSTLVHLDYNDIGSQGGSLPLSTNGNLSLSPSFVDAAGGDFHLAGDSPLLGAVPQAYQTIDPDGNNSATSGRMDMGAYNETIFINGFDGN